ncbi:MAG: OsmC family protein [Candidatus Promineifilaceae bacterium]|nr:OsmC family protein [Candidatus Promineifilaceae bacterium]
MSSVAMKWVGPPSQMFVGRDSFGHVVVSGSWPDETSDWLEWKATKPSDLLMLSLASCSAYDVVMILSRQRQGLTGLYIQVEAEQDSQPPYAFRKAHLHYRAEGDELDPRKVERAIKLSHDKYCSVAATIKGVTQLTFSFEIV